MIGTTVMKKLMASISVIIYFTIYLLILLEELGKSLEL